MLAAPLPWSSSGEGNGGGRAVIVNTAVQGDHDVGSAVGRHPGIEPMIKDGRRYGFGFASQPGAQGRAIRPGACPAPEW